MNELIGLWLMWTLLSAAIIFVFGMEFEMKEKIIGIVGCSVFFGLMLVAAVLLDGGL